MQHSVPLIGVNASGSKSSDANEYRVEHSLNNSLDHFSGSKFFATEDGKSDEQGWKAHRTAAMWAPHSKYGNRTSGYGVNEAVDAWVGLFHGVMLLVGSFTYYFLFLSVRYITGASNTDAALASLLVAAGAAAPWYFIAKFWPRDNRFATTLNPAIEFARFLTFDNLGFIPMLFNVGVMLGGGALAGLAISQLGWTQYWGGPACTSVTPHPYTPAGGACLDVWINDQIVRTAAGAQAYPNTIYAMDWLLCTLIVCAFILCKKFVPYLDTDSWRWARTCASTAGTIFGTTFVGSYLGFYGLNPGVFFAQYVATGQTDIITTDGVTDFTIFFAVRLLAAGAGGALFYYVLRVIVKASVEIPIDIRASLTKKKRSHMRRRSGSYELQTYTPAPAASQIGASLEEPLIQTGSAGLKFRQSSSIRADTPLIVNYE